MLEARAQAAAAYRQARAAEEQVELLRDQLAGEERTREEQDLLARQAAALDVVDALYAVVSLWGRLINRFNRWWDTGISEYLGSELHNARLACLTACQRAHFVVDHGDTLNAIDGIPQAVDDLVQVTQLVAKNKWKRNDGRNVEFAERRLAALYELYQKLGDALSDWRHEPGEQA